MIKQGKVDKTYEQLCQDMRQTVWRQYLHFSKDFDILPAKDYGTFFPEVFANPTRFIQPQPDLREVLLALRKQGKCVFLGTNSHWEYMELIMSTTLGSDWRKCFDFVFCFCRKPAFFNTDNPMFLMDRSAPKFHGKQLDSFKDLEPDSGVTYLEGNRRYIEDYLKNKHGRETIKIAFLGDQYTTDVHWSN